MSIRVANIIIEGRWGGPQKRILETAKGLKQEYDIETFVVLPKTNNSSHFKKKLKDSNISYIEVKLTRPQKSIFRNLQFLLFFLWEVLCLAKVLKQKKIDIVHCNSPEQIHGVVSAILAKKKIIWHLNNTAGGFFRYPVLLLGRYIDIFCVSANKVREVLLDKNFLKRKPIYLIRPPVDTTKFSGSLSTNSSDEPHKITVGTICTINPIKDLSLFLEVAELLWLTKNDNFTFVLAGVIYDSQAKYGNIILNRIDAMKQKGIDIKYTGIEMEPVKFYNKIDVFLCTSLRESGPMTVFEAMSMQKAVVTSNVGDLRNIITDGTNGFVIESRNPKDFVNKLLMLSKDRKLLEDFGRNARKKIIEECDVKVCALKHMEMYKAVQNGFCGQQ